MTRRKQSLLLSLAAAAILGTGGFVLSARSTAGNVVADPAAVHLWEKTQHVYQSMASFEGIVSVEKPAASPIRVQMQYRRPNRLALLCMASDSTRRIVTDGQRMNITYLRGTAPGANAPTPPTAGNLYDALRQGGLEETVLARLVTTSRSDAIRLPKDLTLRGQESVGGIAVQRLSFTQETDSGPQTVLCDFGSDDHLLYRVIVQDSKGVMQRTEYYTAFRPNAPLAESVFVVRAAETRFVPPSAPTSLPAFGTPLSAMGTAGAAASAPLLREERYPFGECDPLASPRLRHEFVLKNTTERPLTISHLAASCGCMSTLLTKKGGRATPTSGANSTAPAQRTILAPGEEGIIEVTVDVSTLRPGPLSKSVTVYAAPNDGANTGGVGGAGGTNRAQAVARFELSGRILPVAEFTPALLEFGSANPKKSRPVEFTLKASPELLRQTKGTAPRLASSLPCVHIEPIPAATTEGGAIFRYRATLTPDAPLGVLDGSVWIAAENLTAADTVRSALLRRAAAVPIVGNAVGPVTPEPALLALGTVSSQTDTTATLRLRYERGVRRTGIHSENSLLKIEARETTGSDEETITVRIPAGTPPGVLRGTLLISLSNGQRLRVPVTGSIQSGATKAGTR